ncbi:hypothetical protein [Rhodopirellula halodulae]|uniref:hypothetical protein n=1 Tax=Rhodopirellula halodulae TaxID=2894198 RepID=UPI001E38DB01|nr:hypothetical protein [Rhodopirellula sp. JC737]MCC9656196.1 hypothetical protein [Rhodopirellula sp. JC737]
MPWSLEKSWKHSFLIAPPKVDPAIAKHAPVKIGPVKIGPVRHGLMMTALRPGAIVPSIAKVAAMHRVLNDDRAKIVTSEKDLAVGVVPSINVPMTEASGDQTTDPIARTAKWIQDAAKVIETTRMAPKVMAPKVMVPRIVVLRIVAPYIANHVPPAVHPPRAKCCQNLFKTAWI